MDIGLGHIQGGVAQDALERHDVSAVHQIVDGEGVAKQMWVESGNTSPVSQCLDAAGERIIGERKTLDRQKETLLVGVEGFTPPGGQVAGQRLSCRVGEGHDPLLVSLASDQDPALVQECVGESQPTQLAGSYPGVKQENEDGVLSRPQVGVGVDRIDERLDLLFGEDLDHRLWQAWPLQLGERISRGQALGLQPTAEGLERSHIAVDRAGRETALARFQEGVVFVEGVSALHLGNEPSRVGYAQIAQAGIHALI